MIGTLVQYKHEWKRIPDRGFDKLKQALEPFLYDPLFLIETHELPDNKALARDLKLNQIKANKLINDMYQALLESFKEKPLEIKEYYHSIRIGRSWEEAGGYTKQQEYTEEKAQYIKLKLTFTPRVGDSIDLSFLADPEKFTNGYVSRVTHIIKGNTQEIFVEVHPYKDYYHQWLLMKQRYEKDSRRGL